MLRVITNHQRATFRGSTRIVARTFSSGPPCAKNKKTEDDDDDLYSRERVNSCVGHSFPDFIEWWNRDNFRKVGYGLAGATALSAVAPFAADISLVPALVMGSLTAGYWRLGLKDMKQTSHAIRRNYPVLGNMRYVLETVSASS